MRNIYRRLESYTTALSTAVREVSDALIVVDGVSCVGGVQTEMDAWGIDIMVTGSQKAFMLPAGLTFVAASERAWAIIETQYTTWLLLRPHKIP